LKKALLAKTSWGKGSGNLVVHTREKERTVQAPSDGKGKPKKGKEKFTVYSVESKGLFRSSSELSNKSVAEQLARMINRAASFEEREKLLSIAEKLGLREQVDSERLKDIDLQFKGVMALRTDGSEGVLTNMGGLEGYRKNAAAKPDVFGRAYNMMLEKGQKTLAYALKVATDFQAFAANIASSSRGDSPRQSSSPRQIDPKLYGRARLAADSAKVAAFVVEIEKFQDLFFRGEIGELSKLGTEKMAEHGRLNRSGSDVGNLVRLVTGNFTKALGSDPAFRVSSESFPGEMDSLMASIEEATRKSKTSTYSDADLVQRDSASLRTLQKLLSSVGWQSVKGFYDNNEGAYVLSERRPKENRKISSEERTRLSGIRDALKAELDAANARKLKPRNYKNDKEKLGDAEKTVHEYTVGAVKRAVDNLEALLGRF
jgi:hypothetical protein